MLLFSDMPQVNAKHSEIIKCLLGEVMGLLLYF